MKTKLNIQKKIEGIIGSIERASRMSIENPNLLRDYIRESLAAKAAITFYDWECPPRFLDRTTDGKLFVNYDVNLKDIFQSKRIDSFTELPKVVEYKEQERENAELLCSFGIRFQFVKLIADTNFYYLTPGSLTVLGKKKIGAKMSEFQSLVQRGMKNYPCDTKVYRFTEIIRNYREEYDKNFRYSLDLLRSSPEKLISKKILYEQFRRTKEHVGLRKKEEILRFSLRVIATYAAEGMIFEKLSADALPNCVWLNSYEADRRTVEITNCLRKKRGLPGLPMIFPRRI